MKLISAAVCILAVTAVSAMPVGEHESKESTVAAVAQTPSLNVVPLEKSADKSLEKAAVETKEITQPNQIRTIEEQSEAEPQLIDKKKADESKQEEKESEVKLHFVDEIKANESMQVKKPEELLNLAPSDKHEQMSNVNAAIATHKEIQEIQEPAESTVAAVKETIIPVADTQSASAVVVVPDAAIVEPAQAKRIDVPIATEKNIDETTKEVVKVEEKPDRVTRGTIENVQESKAVEKNSDKIESILAVADKIAAGTITPAAATATEEKLDESSIQVTAEEKKLKIETGGIAIDSAEPKKAEQKPVEIAAAELNKRENAQSEVQAKSGDVSETIQVQPESLNPVQKNLEIIKEQRSEDTAGITTGAHETKPTQIVPQKEITAFMEEGPKAALVADAEKTAKSTEEIKPTEELTQQAKEVKPAIAVKSFEAAEVTKPEEFFHKSLSFEMESAPGMAAAIASATSATDKSNSEEKDSSSEEKPAAQLKEVKKEMQDQSTDEKKEESSKPLGDLAVKATTSS